MNTIKKSVGLGGTVGGSPYLSVRVNLTEICCHSCVICDCIEKMKSKHLYFLRYPFFLEPTFSFLDVFVQIFLL